MQKWCYADHLGWQRRTIRNNMRTAYGSCVRQGAPQALAAEAVRPFVCVETGGDPKASLILSREHPPGSGSANLGKRDRWWVHHWLALFHSPGNGPPGTLSPVSAPSNGDELLPALK
jgi:hypothetical protein